MSKYLIRLVDALLDDILAAQPAVMLVGPRATGKTTTAERRARSTVRLDRASEAGAFLADPDSALRGLREPVLIDEWQEVPGVLGAVKRAVDSNPSSGRFIITGSVRGDISGETWPGTGRIIRVPLHGLTVREQLGRAAGPTFLDRLVQGQQLSVPASPPDLRGYVELALRGGFPSAIGLADSLRESWLESYVDQIVTRDAVTLGRLRDPARLRRFVHAYALNSAGLVSDQTLFEAAGLDRKTANVYERLLSDLFIVEPLPAWTSSRLQRLVRNPKRYLIDPSLVGAILRADADTVMRDSDLMGRLIDTFVAAQFRAERAVARCRPVLYHLRERQGRHEIDLLAEIRGQQVIACEIKATAAPGPRDAQHLAWMRDRLGDRFLAGVVLGTGSSVYSIGEKIVAAPIAALWG